MANDKFKALVHYIVSECPDAGQLGSIRLNKTLWYVDYDFFLKTGRSVTGVDYVRKDFGPVPREIHAAVHELVAEGKISVSEPGGRYRPRMFISKEVPQNNHLSKDEEETARRVLEWVMGHYASEISEKTHDLAWEAAFDGEVIPFRAVMAANIIEPDDDARAWASQAMLRLEGRTA